MENSSFSERQAIHIELNSSGGGLHTPRLDAILRRLLDIVVSSLGLLLLSPVFLLIAAAIKRDSPGPVFYRGRRMGRGGKVFGILKFRTMVET